MHLRMTVPNFITVIRILMIPLFVLAMIQAGEDEQLYRLVALGLFGLMALGDGLDGYFARKLNQRTVMGAFLDPMADKLMMFCAYVMLAGKTWPEPRMPVWVSTVVISRDALIGLGFLTLFVLTGRLRMVTPSGVGKLCTVVQALTILGVFGSPWLMAAAGATAGWWIMTVLFLLTVFLTLFSGVDYLYAGRLYLLHSEQVTLTVEDRPGRIER